MVRPYAIKGYKMKKSERYDKEEEDDGSFEIEYGIPIPPPQSQQSKPKPQAGVIFVLERASLEVGKVGKTYQLLNSDNHLNFLRNNGKSESDYRPDIVHQVGAMAHGKIEPDYVDDFIAVSNYPLSAARCTTMICQSLEEKWNII